MPYLVYRKNDGALIPVSSFFSATELADFLKEKLSLSEEDNIGNIAVFETERDFDYDIEGFLVQSRTEFTIQEIATFFKVNVNTFRQRYTRSILKMRSARIGALLRKWEANDERKNDESKYIFGVN